ncbi:MAG: hypothetical protein KH331_05445 [Subdoligranulum variabile]|nr:hypothetical protein [Subdoligranulum variabile]
MNCIKCNSSQVRVIDTRANGTPADIPPPRLHDVRLPLDDGGAACW